MSKVCILKVDSYDEEKVYEALKNGVDLLGGFNIKKDEKILLKPNLLNGATPDKAVTTHPAVFGAVAKCLKEKGYENISYGDGPGIGAPDIDKVMAVSGIKEAADKYDLKHARFEENISVEFKEGKVAKKFNLAKDAYEADSIISVCKMKTHALENITGALKNQYGCVATLSKGMGHAKYPNSRLFADMITDLNMLLKPRLFVMDGIVAMEGNGPGSGDPTNMNVILISTDPVALDTIFSVLVYLDPEAVPTTVSAHNSGLGTMNLDEIEVVTEDGIITPLEAQEKFGNPNFNVKRKKPKFWKVGAAASSTIKQFDKPVVDLKKCIACGICEKSCPVEGKAVKSGNGMKAKYDYSKCIRCYCCQEMCPANAIKKRFIK